MIKREDLPVGYRLIHEKVLNNFIGKSKFDIVNAVDVKPTFKPDPNLGEGKASKPEHDYRAELIGLLALVYPLVTKIVENRELSTDQKIVKINGIVDSHFSPGETIVRDNTKKILDNAVVTGNLNLKKLDKSIDTQTPNSTFLQSIQDQQRGNLGSIKTGLTDKLSEGLREDEVHEQLNSDYQSSFDYIDGAFVNAQTRLDGMGWYGWYQSNNLGLVGTYAMGSVILGSLVADWITAGDDKVCDDCQQMADNGPYSVLNWPEEQHFGDRCEMGTPYLEGT